MPPKKVEQKKQIAVSDSDSDSNHSVEIKPVKKPLLVPKKIENSQFITEESVEKEQPKKVDKLKLKSKSDVQHSMTQLEFIQLFKNIFEKTQPFMEAVETFNKLKEGEFKSLSMKMQAVQQEYEELNSNLEKEYTNKTTILKEEYLNLKNELQKNYTINEKNISEAYSNKEEELDKSYQVKNKQLSESYKNKVEELDKIYQNKNKQLEENYLNKNKSYEDEIQQKKRELENILKTNDQQLNHQKIDINQKLLEFKLEGCKKILEPLGMEIIDSKIFKKLTDDLDVADAIKAKVIHEITETLNKEHNLEKKNIITSYDLTHKAQLAQLTAEVNQKEEAIKVLKNTIETLKHELSEQRNLTKEVAQAGSKPQINQNISPK